MSPLFLLVTLVGLALVGIASLRVHSTFRKYQRVGVRSGMTGAEAAAAVCRAGGAHDVTIERHQGFLSDHYDPRHRTLRLSPAVFEGRSVSSIAVAAHEAGHAIQHAESYAWLSMRSSLVPVVMVANNVWMWFFLAGALLSASAPAIGKPLFAVGVGLFGLGVLFQLVTLPVEFDASRRAKAVLATAGIVQTQEEAVGVQQVLGAAAMTYVAGAAASVLQFLLLLWQLFGHRE
ncbi:MAG TPA: zinc metallopeptidase [Planctomycetota bacterium]|nr:zinc metallopeptidase [Planctomycetota bacterium]